MSEMKDIKILAFPYWQCGQCGAELRLAPQAFEPGMTSAILEHPYSVIQQCVLENRRVRVQLVQHPVEVLP